jgi:hypothetical protein
MSHQLCQIMKCTLTSNLYNLSGQTTHAELLRNPNTCHTILCAHECKEQVRSNHLLSKGRQNKCISPYKYVREYLIRITYTPY